MAGSRDCLPLDQLKSHVFAWASHCGQVLECSDWLNLGICAALKLEIDPDPHDQMD